MFRLLSPSLFISIAALMISLGGAGYSATGNGASASVAAFSADLAPDGNAKAAAGAPGVDAALDQERAPIRLASVEKAGINADLLDGIDSTLFARKVTVSFNLAPGAFSAPIPIPTTGPVFVMGVAAKGAGMATLHRVPGAAGILAWISVQSGGSSGASSNVQGTHIISIDGYGSVYVEVFSSTAVRVHNTRPTAGVQGNIVLLY